MAEGILYKLANKLGAKKYLILDQSMMKQRIEPKEGWEFSDLVDVWRYRTLLYFFTWRNIKVRYKQTVMGASWAILQPFLTMIVFSLFFGRLAEMPSDDVPYPIFSYAALVPWTFFANSVTQSSNSVVSDANMIKKIYFPRLTMPISSVFAAVIDFLFAFSVLLAMMLYYGFLPTANVLWLPVFLLLAVLTAMGVSFWLAALNVQFRDVRYTVPFMVQAWLFATPIAYPSNLLSEPWRTVYGLNPMAGVVDGFRWALLGTATGPGPMTYLSAVAAILLFVSGMYYFQRMENTFADVA